MFRIVLLVSIFCSTSAFGAVITFSYDLNDIVVATTGAGGTYTPAGSTANVTLTGSNAEPVLTVPQGASVQIGVDVQLAGAGQYGIGIFQNGLTDSNASVAQVNAGPKSGSVGNIVGYGPGGNKGPFVNPFFGIVTDGRNVSDNAGGISTQLGVGGGNFVSGESTSKTGYGDSGPAALYSGLQIDTTGPVGTFADFTLTNLNSALTYIVTDPSDPEGYKEQMYSAATDTITPLPQLTIIIVPEPASLGLTGLGGVLLMRRRKQRMTR